MEYFAAADFYDIVCFEIARRNNQLDEGDVENLNLLENNDNQGKFNL